MLPNSIEWFEGTVAIARLGAQLVPINWHLKPDELSWILSDSDARVLLTHVDLSDVASAAITAVPACSLLVVGDDFEAALAAEPAEPLAGAGSPAPSIVLYTSGTTGRPKGVMHQRDTTTRSRAVLSDLWGYNPDDVHLLVGPAYHGAPWSMAFTHLTLGATLVVMPRWNAASFLDLVARYRVTNTFVVPTHFSRLLELPDAVLATRDFSSLRLVLHSAAACPVAVKRRAIELFVPTPVWEFYGFSEGGRLTRIGSDEWLEHPGSVGRAIEGVSIAILDDNGIELPPGETGWIHAVPARRRPVRVPQQPRSHRGGHGAHERRRGSDRWRHRVPRRRRLPLHHRPIGRVGGARRREHLPERDGGTRCTSIPRWSTAPRSACPIPCTASTSSRWWRSPTARP